MGAIFLVITQIQINNSQSNAILTTIYLKMGKDI